MSEPANKRATTEESISVMTFSAGHDRFARLQLLSTQTLYALVSALCKYTAVGYEGSEDADDHLWYITYNGVKYESSDYECESPLRANRARLDSLELAENCVLHLTYDYGTTSNYMLKFLGQRSLTSDENPGMFPRNDVSNAMPPGYSRYAPSTINGNEPYNLDTKFPDLQQWVFNASGKVVVNLFQPGKKHNYGFMENGRGGMLFLPVKAGDLSNYMQYFNDGARLKPKGLETDGYAHFDWHSVVILPRSNLTDQLRRKYYDNRELGFCDAAVVDDVSDDLNAYFPKIAALAGYRKDSKVPRGWITFTKRGRTCDLVICKGNSVNYKSNAPEGTAYDGDGQHRPAEDPIIEVSGVDVRGLNDLFCVVEGLLRTL